MKWLLLVFILSISLSNYSFADGTSGPGAGTGANYEGSNQTGPGALSGPRYIGGFSNTGAGYNGSIVTGSPTPPTTPELTIVLYMMDDVDSDIMTAYGGTVPAGASTPNIDRLSTDGARFTQAYVAQLCQLTKEMINAGQWGFRTTQPYSVDIDHSFGKMAKATGSVPLLYGKAYPGGTNNWGMMQMGWDEAYALYALIPSPGYRQWTLVSQTQDAYDDALIAPGGLESNDPITVEGMATYAQDYFDDEAISGYLNRDRNTQLLIWNSPPLLHDPRHIPNADIPNNTCPAPNTSDDCFAAMVNKMDASIGKLLGSFDLSTTLIFILPDNSRSAKGTLYEGGIRVPMWVIGAGVTPGSTITDAVSGPDIYTTILDILGTTTYGGSATLDGYSFSTLIGYSCGWTGRCWINRTGEVYGVSYNLGSAVNGVRIYRDTDHVTYGNYKLWYENQSQNVWLYNLSSYPGYGSESANLCTDLTCSNLTSTNLDAYNHLCAGLNALDTTLTPDCPALGGGGASLWGSMIWGTDLWE